jgi:hypothetical protein
MRRAEPCAAGLVLIAGACGVLLLGGASWTNLSAAAASLAAIGFGLWRAGWIGSRHRIVRVHWLADGRWLLDDGRAKGFAGELAAGTRLARDALWLRWRTPNGRLRTLLLARGDLPETQRRALSVRLRIEALERVLPEAPRR